MEVGAAETGREGGKWEKKKQQRRTRERHIHTPKEREEKDSFVRWGDETVIVPWYHPYTHPTKPVRQSEWYHPSIHPTKPVRQSEWFGRPAARTRALSLLSLSLSACDDGFACCLGLCLPPLAPKSFTAVSNGAMI